MMILGPKPDPGQPTPKTGIQCIAHSYDDFNRYLRETKLVSTKAINVCQLLQLFHFMFHSFFCRFSGTGTAFLVNCEDLFSKSLSSGWTMQIVSNDAVVVKSHYKFDNLLKFDDGRSSSVCLHALRPSSDVMISLCTGEILQQWAMNKMNDGRFQLQSVLYPDQCLGVQGAVTPGAIALLSLTRCSNKDSTLIDLMDLCPKCSGLIGSMLSESLLMFLDPFF